MGNRRTTNCPNCGAALPVSGLKCEFCGTRIVDLTMIDFDSKEPTIYVLKRPKVDADTPSCYIYVYARAESLNFNTEVCCFDGRPDCTFDLVLRAYENPDTHEMFKVCYEE